MRDPRDWGPIALKEIVSLYMVEGQIHCARCSGIESVHWLSALSSSETTRCCHSGPTKPRRAEFLLIEYCTSPPFSVC
jgi:hypothetical protein